ncbi:hypothetical protein HNY73_001299 [Argiope bruennichi]|uniref:Uncharacterized protein n=1 Tax=Argiope bruennichi TaxID=94029 RepID=A0A8T0G4I9_ARGBR|nr:hypothetical protein HNY73_001299 [Argiope bruennichi]
MHRSTSLPGGRSSEGKKISLTELPNSSSRSSKKSDKSKSSSSSSSSQQQQQQQQQQQMQQLPNSRSMDVSELRRLGNPRQGPPPELLADAMAATGNQMSSSSSSSSSSTMDRQRRALHSIQEHPSGPLSGRFTPQLQQPSPKGGYGGSNTATLPARWRSSLPPRPSSEMRGSFSDTGSSGGSGTEVRRLVVRKNGVRFQGKSRFNLACVVC